MGTEFGKQPFVQLLKDRGISLTQLCKLITDVSNGDVRYSIGHISRVGKGTFRATPQFRHAVATTLGEPEDALFTTRP